MYVWLYERFSIIILQQEDGMTVVASRAPALSCVRGRRAVMVARMSWPLAVETVLDEGPMSSNPSADWMKLLVAPESNMASLMALLKA